MILVPHLFWVAFILQRHDYNYYKQTDYSLKNNYAFLMCSYLLAFSQARIFIF